MKLTAMYSSLSFQSRLAQLLLHKQAVSALKSAVKVWVTTAEAMIPVWSGMSRGTLIKVGDFVGYNVSSFSISPNAPADRRSEGKEEGHIKATLGKSGKYKFEFSTTLYHLRVNENVDATVYGLNLHTPGPYNFREAANKAAEEALRNAVRRIPFASIFEKSLKITSQRTG